MMEMFVKKLVVLMVFTLMLFLVARLLEYIAWYETGLIMMKLVDPVALSVRKLKSILDGRGLSYEGVVDKAELTHLVAASGELVEGEVLLMDREQEEEEEEDSITTFSSKARFDEEVEDKKDSVWLVQVIPRNHIPLLGQKAWHTVEGKLSRFGIRHGTFDCSIDPRICAQKRWNLPLLLLAMPQGQRHKDHVTMATFKSAGKAHQIIRWVNMQLASKVKAETLVFQDDSFLDRFTDGRDAILRMVLFSAADHPPMFFSALNLKYSGRIRFIFVNVKDGVDIKHARSDQKWKLPAYVIITPEGARKYGSKSGEYHTYRAMDVYLRSMSPEANDIFILSFLNVNLVCFIGLFVIQGGVAKRICTFMWTIGKYNITFLLLWLPLLGIIQLPCLSPILDLTYKMIRLTAESWLASKLRQDWLMYSGHVYIISSAFLVYCVGVNWLLRKFHTSTREDRMTSAMWLRASLTNFYSFLLRPSPSLLHRPTRNGHLEEGFDMFIEQMAIPDLWLHPAIPTDYIQDLLTWQYSCDWLQNQSSSNECDSSDSEKGRCSCRSHKNKCRKLQECLYNNTLVSSCKLDNVHRCGKKNINYFSREVEKNESFFHNRSQEKTICHQPGSFSVSDSDNMINLCANSNFNPPKCMDTQESKLDHNAKESNQVCGNVDNDFEENSENTACKCCQCSNETYSSDNCQKKLKPETLCSSNSQESLNVEKSTEISATETSANTVINKPSPRRFSRAVKTKPSPKPDKMAAKWPEGMLFNAQCAICLDAYTHGVTVCGLPCGHSYHRQCIVSWLSNGNHECPICRWPAYKKKGCKLSKHME